jgi:hypothetical protein
VQTKPGSKSESCTTVRALIGIDPCPMATVIVRATDQQAANASGAHLCESDLLGEGGHALLKRESLPPASPQDSFSEGGRHRTASRPKRGGAGIGGAGQCAEAERPEAEVGKNTS